MDNENSDSAQKQINVALMLLRTAIKQYRASSGWVPPRFILEKIAPKIPGSALKETKVFSDREALLASLPDGGCVAEVGTQHGHWAYQILQTKCPVRLHLFDIKFDILREEVRANKSVFLHAGDSSTALQLINDHYFDWIYIDGDHSYRGVLRDIEQAILKLKPNGLLIFNDYTLWSPMEAIPYGVVAAVNELLQSSWCMSAIALTPTGYWDVALQRI